MANNSSAGRIVRDSLPAIITSLVVSGCGGALGMYVGYRLLEQRITRAEDDIQEIRSDAKIATERLARIEANTEYIRGKMEGREE